MTVICPSIRHGSNVEAFEIDAGSSRQKIEVHRVPHMLGRLALLCQHVLRKEHHAPLIAVGRSGMGLQPRVKALLQSRSDGLVQREEGFVVAKARVGHVIA